MDGWVKERPSPGGAGAHLLKVSVFLSNFDYQSTPFLAGVGMAGMASPDHDERQHRNSFSSFLRLLSLNDNLN